MSIQEDLNEMPMQEEAMPEMGNIPDSEQEIPRHMELMVGLDNMFSDLPPEKNRFMRSLLQEFPSISDAIAQELQVSMEEVDMFFAKLAGDESAQQEQMEMEAPTEQPVDQTQPPVNEVDRMLQAGRGQEQPLI